jgi:glycosyltransferase involved in cell wall biosynthesis
MRYSVIIPAHNEAANLEALLTRFIEDLPPSVTAVLAEVLVVENGSTDGTLEVAQALERRFPTLVRVLSIPRGSYGEAIKHGMEQSRGTHLSILECDVLDDGFVAESIRLFREGRAEFIIASKQHRHSVDRRPWMRRLLTRGFNGLLHALVGYPGSDTHGLKSIEGKLARRLCGLTVSTDEVLQTEIVLLAWRLGHCVVEVPIEIGETRPTPVRILRRVPKVIPMLWELRRSLSRFPPRPIGWVG